MKRRDDLLRERLRRALSGRPASGAARGASSSADREAERAPDARVAPGPPPSPKVVLAEPVVEGRLLVWRERLADGDFDGARARELFGVHIDFASRLAAAGRDVARLAFVDIESCGLADVPVFLVGALTLSPEGGAWRLEQFLAPDPSAEPELLARTAALLGSHADWVSFNGRSFDLPRLRRRASTHSVDWPAGASHVDLLHAVRKRWRGELPDCRLGTVERAVLGLGRGPGDVPGREVPERYWDYVHSGERRWIDPVIDHNRRDVAALAALAARLVIDETPE